jgi:alpha-tubulin suppressor-like RCC1 family protein
MIAERAGVLFGRGRYVLARILGLVLLGIVLPACGTSGGGGGTLTPTVAPQVPATLSGVAGPHRAALSWQASPGASTYTLRKALFSGGPYTEVPGATDVSTQAFVDTGLLNGTAYYYVLRAGNSFGTSADSEEVKVVPGFKADQVAAGDSFSVAHLKDGSIWAWGTNSHGQLGLPAATAFSTVAVEVPLAAPILSIACGNAHTLGLASDGRVWAWGDNGKGQLGKAAGPSSPTPAPIDGLAGITAVSGGTEFSLALKNDGTVWAWGGNSSGELGNGPGPDASVPQPVASLADVVAISAGSQVALAVRNDGTVWAWGLNSAQLLGVGLASPPLGIPVQVVSLEHIVAVAAGIDHTGSGNAFSLALDADGHVWGWGLNSHGQLGDGTENSTSFRVLANVNGIVAIAAGEAHSLALGSDGTVWAWGTNALGAVGVPLDSNPDVMTPVQSSGLEQIRGVAAGTSHSLAVGLDGTVWGFGSDVTGELGNGGGALQLAPVLVPNLDTVSGICARTFHCYALRADTSMWGWGSAGLGETGDGLTSTTVQTTPTWVAYSSLVVGIAAGGASGLALLNDGVGDWALYSWGQDTVGQLGQNLPPGVWGPGPVAFPPSLPPTFVVIAVAAGENHGLALGQVDGDVWSWGWNGSGQLGSGIVGNASSPVQVMTAGGGGLVPLVGMSALAAGSNHSLALKSDGTVWAWGDNTLGQLGFGTPPGVSNQAVQVPGISDVTAIYAGGNHTLALKSDGTVWAWGNNSNGQLGVSPATAFRTAPAQVAGLSGIVAIGAGLNHSLAVGTDGTVWTWGSNSQGQLGDGTMVDSSSPAAVSGLPPMQAVTGGWDFSLGLTAAGRIYGWGSNNDGELAQSPAGQAYLPFAITH